MNTMKLSVLIAVSVLVAASAAPDMDPSSLASSDSEPIAPPEPWPVSRTTSIKLDSSELNQFFGVEDADDVPEYEIVYPMILTEEGAVAITSDEAPADSLQITVDAFGESLHLNLRHDDEGMTPEVVKISKEGETTIPLRTDRMYSGFVTSDPESIVSADTSLGLTAIIFYDKGSLVIQPMGEKHAKLGRGLPHIAYKGSDDGTVCGVEDVEIDGIEADEVGIDAACDVPSTKYLELAFYYDFQAWTKAGEAFASQATTLFNLVKAAFQRSSLVGTKLVPKCVKTAYFADEAVFHSPADGTIYDTLYKACDYCRDNPLPMSDPQHWDNAAFVSGRPIKGISGLGYIGTCGKEHSVSVSMYRDLSTMAGTMCHEIGHNLGMRHDKTGKCGPDKYIMDPYTNKNKIKWEWSSCSRSYFCAFLGKNTCYDDA